MIPSLLLISSSKTLCVTLTQKKNLKIGIQKDSDIVINHPYFVNHTEVLGRGSKGSELQTKTKTLYIFPLYRFKVDEFIVCYIYLKRLFYILFLFCLVTVFTFSFLPDHRDQSYVQNWTPIALPAYGIYGFCRQDRTHREGIHFKFKAIASQSYRLLLFVGGKGDGTIIKLSLNGFETDISLPLPTGWRGETSLVLPSALVKDGENSVVIIPENHTNNQIFWGISEVQVVPVARSNSTAVYTPSITPEEVLNALSDKDLTGADLASFYKTVGGWNTSVTLKNSSISRDRIMAEIERRMIDKLHQVAFKVRSNQMLDYQSTSRQILDETADWLPEHWVEGWEIFRELYQ